MRRLLVSGLKVAGIALAYATVGYMFCRTAKVCGWEPFLRWHAGDNVDAWRLFINYYHIFLEVSTVLVAFLAGRSYRPFFQVGGVAAGTAAVLIFRLWERGQWTRPESVGYTFFEAAFLGVVFALLGSMSGRAEICITKAKNRIAVACL